MKICPVCSVRIADDLVLFSSGKPGNKDRLRSRVCQYVAKYPEKYKDCINDGGKVLESEMYGDPNIDKLIERLQEDSR